MEMKDFEKLKTGARLLKTEVSGSKFHRIYVGLVKGQVITCHEDGGCPAPWHENELHLVSIYEPPKKKVKLYLYINHGVLTKNLFTEDISHYWNGIKLIPSECIGDSAKWIRLKSSFIEVEI